MLFIALSFDEVIFVIVTVTLNASIDKAYYLDSAVVDGTVHRVSVVDNSAGGKGLNASRTITTLNYPVCATGFVGGNNGRYLIELAQKDGIATDFIYTEQETRSCINILDPSGQSTEFLEPGQPISPEELLAFKAKLVQLTSSAEVVTFNGSIPKGVSAEDYKELIKDTMSAGVPCILDASGSLLTTCLEALPTMIKPNTDEIGQLLGREVITEEEIVAAAQELHNRGIKIVVVSLGAQGALMVSDEGIFRAMPPKIEVINPVGAGDTLVGSFAVALAQGKTTSECLTFALSCATASCLAAGTGRFDQGVAEEIHRNVALEKIVY